jgi:hypothetical protein
LACSFLSSWCSRARQCSFPRRCGRQCSPYYYYASSIYHCCSSRSPFSARVALGPREQTKPGPTGAIRHLASSRLRHRLLPPLLSLLFFFFFFFLGTHAGGGVLFASSYGRVSPRARYESGYVSKDHSDHLGRLSFGLLRASASTHRANVGEFIPDEVPRIRHTRSSQNAHSRQEELEHDRDALMERYTGVVPEALENLAPRNATESTRCSG